MICFYCNRVSRYHFIRLTYHAYNFEKDNKIVSGVSPRLPFAWPQVDRPSRLLSFARPPGSSAWLVRLAPGLQLSCALFRWLITLAYCNILPGTSLFWVMGHVLLLILPILPILPLPPAI